MRKIVLKIFYTVENVQGRQEEVGGGAEGAICPGPPAKGGPHKKRMKYAVKINSNTLTKRI